MRMQLTKSAGACLLAGAMVLSFAATAAEGLYSADGLMDAEVFSSTGEEVGDVEDILMGDAMNVHSLVIETDALLEMGGREIVAERGTFTVKTLEGGEWDDIEYEVHLQATEEEMKNFPVYDKGWWNQTTQALAQAWENTQEISASAWESTKQATGAAWQNIQQGLEELGDEVEQATE